MASVANNPATLEELEAENISEMATVDTVPPPPADFKGESDANPNFRTLGSLAPSIERKIEPYGAQFLAYARRKRHGRTFSEDDRIQAASRARKTEEDDDGEISEPEDPMMLARDAKDWRVCHAHILHNTIHLLTMLTGSRSLCRARSLEVPLQRYVFLPF